MPLERNFSSAECRAWWRWLNFDVRVSSELIVKKLKCPLVQALRLCTGRTAHRGSSGIALPFHDHGTIRELEVSVTPRPLLTPRKTWYPLYRRLGGHPGPVWTGAENLTPTGIRSPDRPGRSQSLYRLSYPADISCVNALAKILWFWVCKYADLFAEPICVRFWIITSPALSYDGVQKRKIQCTKKGTALWTI